MQSLNQRDLYWVLRRAPKCVVELMKSQQSLFLAGGFVRACIANEEPSDVDLFAPDEERADLYARVLAGPDGRVWKSANATTIRRPDVALPVQVIHRWTYARPEDLIESFDFTVAKSVIWCTSLRDERTHRAGWGSLTHNDFYADLAAKRLVYTMPKRNEDAGGSLLRVLKFYQKGYRIPLDSLGAVVARLVQGVDLAPKTEEEKAAAIIALLHEVDPLQDPLHIFHLPTSQEPNFTE